MHQESRRGLMLIGVLKLLKAAGLVVLGVGVLSLLHRDAEETIRHWAEFPARRHPRALGRSCTGEGRWHQPADHAPARASVRCCTPRYSGPKAWGCYWPNLGRST